MCTPCIRDFKRIEYALQNYTIMQGEPPAQRVYLTIAVWTQLRTSQRRVEDYAERKRELRHMTCLRSQAQRSQRA